MPQTPTHVFKDEAVMLCCALPSGWCQPDCTGLSLKDFTYTVLAEYLLSLAVTGLKKAKFIIKGRHFYNFCYLMFAFFLMG